MSLSTHKFLDWLSTTQSRTWLLVSTLIVLIHAPLLTKPFVDSDEAVYASIAALTNRVGHLYGEGGVDNKFPGIYWIYASVFRLCGQYSMNAVHVLTIIFVLATAAILGRVAARIGHPSAAWIVALFYGIATTLYTPKMLGANTEVFTMLPISVAVLISLPDAASRRPGLLPMYLAGLLIGAATVIRQLAALNLLLICGLPLFWLGVGWWRRLATACVSALGFATVACVTAYYFLRQGNLADIWFWTVTVVGQRYLPDGWHFDLPLHQLAMLAETSVFCTLLVLRARTWKTFSFAEKAIWAWLVLSIGIVVLPGRFHPHYAIQAFAPVAVLSAIEFRQRLDRAQESKDRRFLRWCSGLLGVLTIVFAILAVLWEPFAPAFLSQAQPRYLAVARHIRETTASDDRVFVWGAYTPIYVMSERLPATRFVAFKRGCGRAVHVPFDACWDSGPEMWPLLQRDLEVNAPRLIVDTAPANLGDFAAYPIKNFPVLRDLLAAHYSFDRNINGVDIYRRLPTDR